jgi:AraC-like DNA-binding protein
MPRRLAGPDAFRYRLISMEYGFQHHEQSRERYYRAFLHHARDVPSHWHNEMEILVVLRGETYLCIDGQNATVSAGNVIIINEGVLHHTSAASADNVICGLHINVERCEYNGLAEFSQRHYMCKSYLHGPYFDHKILPIKAIIARILIGSADNPGETVLCDSLIGLLCRHVALAFESVPRPSDDECSSSGMSRIQRIMREVRSNPAAGRSLSVLADREGVTLSHLSRSFRRATGLSFVQYVQNLKLDRSADALRETRRTISDIYTELGFSSGAIFYNHFRRRFGCSPSEYRSTRSHCIDNRGADMSEDIWSALSAYAVKLPEALAVAASTRMQRPPRLSCTPHDVYDATPPAALDGIPNPPPSFA